MENKKIGAMGGNVNENGITPIDSTSVAFIDGKYVIPLQDGFIVESADKIVFARIHLENGKYKVCYTDEYEKCDEETKMKVNNKINAIIKDLKTNGANPIEQTR